MPDTRPSTALTGLRALLRGLKHRWALSPDQAEIMAKIKHPCC